MVFQIPENKDSTSAEKAHRKGERTFTLRAQDKTAPATVCKWITANIETAPADKLREALEDALTMRAWPSRKAAD